METLLVTKIQGSKGKNTSIFAVDMNNKKKGSKRLMHVTGNFPFLCKGMVIKAELRPTGSGYVADDYEVPRTEKNVKAMERDVLDENMIDADTYYKLIQFHKFVGKNYSFKKLCTMCTERNVDIYSVLPFELADKMHKEIENDDLAYSRAVYLSNEFLRVMRSKRTIRYTLREYLAEMKKIQKRGAYPLQSDETIASILMLDRTFLVGGKETDTLTQEDTEKLVEHLDDTVIEDRTLLLKEKYILEEVMKRKKSAKNNFTPLMESGEIDEFILKEKQKGTSRTEEQLETLYSLEDYSPCVITGGAGVGKTTVIRDLIKAYSTYYNRNNIMLCSPTGKASRRLTQATGMEAKTIHKMLRKVPNSEDSPEGYSVMTYYNARNKLDANLIIVDESSMIDVELMYDLIVATRFNTKLVFVGDSNQLYPVGYGEPFFDFQKEGMLDVYSLTINHRQKEGTAILDCANASLTGGKLMEGKGVTIRHVLLSEVGDILKEYENENDIEWKDTQIISPYNKLNEKINDFLKRGEKKYNKGDKVIFLKNTQEYTNGEMGRVQRSEGNEQTIRLDYGWNCSISEDSEDIALGYAITIHKMQGSEAKNIILLLPEEEEGKTERVSSRMLYTGITRARENLEILYYTEDGTGIRREEGRMAFWERKNA